MTKKARPERPRQQRGKRAEADRYVFNYSPSDREPYYVQGPLDFDEFLEGMGRGKKDAGDEFVLRMIQHFIDAVYAKESPRSWVLNYLADQFYKVLHGGRWEDEFPLPWTKRCDYGSQAEWRALAIFCDIANAKHAAPKRPITALIKEAALEWSVSYETARAAYYKHRKPLSKKQARHSE